MIPRQVLRHAVWSVLPVLFTCPTDLYGQPPPRFRTEYVPVDLLAERSRGLLPMKRDQFERLLQPSAASGTAGALQSSFSPEPTATAPPAGLYLAEVFYRARLTQDDRLEGTIALHFKGQADEPTLAPLDPFNLTLLSADMGQNADASLQFGRDGAGKLYCVLMGDAELALRCSLPAETAGNSASTFVVRLPPALRSRIELLLPQECHVSSERGIVKRLDSDGESFQRRSSLEFGPGREMGFQITRAAAAPAESPLLIAREASRYSVLPTSLDVRSSFMLDVLAEPRSEITLHIDSPLELTSARLGDRALDWRVAPATAPPGKTVVTCALAEPLVGTGHEFEVAAVANSVLLPTGVELPRMKLADAVLQEAKRTVESPSWMRLSAQASGEAVKTQFSAPPGTSQPSSFEFLIFGETGGVRVSSQGTTNALVERSATHLTIEHNQVLAKFIGELKSLGGNLFHVEAEVPRQWVVDSVETDPPDMLGERFLHARGSLAQRLVLQLARPITSERSVRLIVRAHFRRPANLQMRAPGGLSLAVFPTAAQRRRLVNLRVRDPQAELRLEGDESLDRLDFEALDAFDRSLFDDEGIGLLFDVDSASDDFRAGLRAALPRYRADVTLENRVKEDLVEQFGRFQCVPEGTALGSIAVRFVPAPRGRVQWRLDGDDTRELTAVVESNSPEELISRVMLPRATSAPVTISATWTASQGAPLSLVMLPEASQLTAIAEIHSDVGHVAVDARSMRPLPMPAGVLQPDRPIVRYSYESGQRSQITIQPTSDRQDLSAAWIEHLELTTLWTATSNVENSAILTLHNAGAPQLKLQLPESVSECRLVEPSGETVLRRGPGGNFDIPLPASDRTAAVKLRYALSDGLVSWPIGRLEVPLPKMNVPVLRRTWTVAMPVNYALVSRDGWNGPDQDGTNDADKMTAWLSSWRHLTTGPQVIVPILPTSMPAPSSVAEGAFRGWRVFSRDLAEAESTFVAVFRPAEFTAYAVSLFFLVIAISRRLTRSIPRLATAGGLAIAAAILLSAPASWLALAAGLGLWCAVLLNALQSARSGPEITPPRTNARSPGIAVWIALASLALAKHAAADPPQLTASSARVVVPIDDNQQPAGEYVYLDLKLYEALHRAAPVEDATRPQWLVQRATYELSPSSAKAIQGAQVIKASYRIHTFRKDTTIELPLERSLFSLVQGESRFDGSPAALRWRADGWTLLVTADEPGEHNLELALATTASQQSAEASVSVRVPPAAVATVAISGGPVSYLDDAALLPLPADPARQSAHKVDAIQVQQLGLWKIRPASAIFESQFRLRSALPIDQVSFVADPRLRPLPNLQSGDFQTEPDPSSPEKYTIYFSEPSEDITFRMEWLWSGTSGVGKLVLPRIRVADALVEEDLAAIELDPALKLVAPATSQATSAGSRFADAWPYDQAAALAAFDLRSMPRHLAIEIQPAVPPPSAALTAQWSFSRRQANLHCNIEITDAAPQHFEHELTVPDQFVVTDLTVLQSGQPAPIRWWQTAAGRLHISLLESPKPAHSITLRGDLPLNRNAKVTPVPPVTIPTATATSSRLRVFRQSDIQLTVDPAAAWKPDTDAEKGRLARGLGRLVADLVLDSNVAAAAAPSVERTPNRPNVSGTLLSKITQAEGDWRCDVDCELTVADGLLDQVRLLVPATWVDALQIEPPMDYRFDPAMTEDQRLLRLEPTEALTGNVKIRVSGPLQYTAGGVQVPNVQVLDVASLERRLLLDDGPAGQTDWELVGLTRIERSGGGRPAGDVQGRLYRITGRQFRAVARYRPGEAKSAETLFLEIETVLSNPRRAISTAHLLLRPASTEKIPFELPPGCRLLQSLVDGAAVATERVGIRTWQIAPASDLLPFQVTLVFEAPVAFEGLDNSLELFAPRLPGLTLPTALWTVRPGQPDAQPSPELSARGAKLGTTDCGSEEAELLRLEAYARALDAVQAARVASVPKQAIAEAFMRWEQLARAADRRLDNDAPPPAAPFTARRRAAREALSAVRQRLFQAELLSEDDPFPPDVSEQRSAAGAAMFLVPRGTLVLQVAQPRMKPSSDGPRWLLALCIAAAAVGFGQTLRLPALGAWFSTHRYLALALAGLAWWLLAPLGWLGWILITAAGWLGLQRLGITLRRRPSLQPNA